MSWNINDDDANVDDLMDNFSEQEQVVVPYALDKKENKVVSEAIIRLEQARLYEMLIKHDLFGDMDVHPVALDKVKKELQGYIVQRLEILLGMRTDSRDAPELPVKETSVTLPFNSSEIEFLKALSFKGTNGNSVKGQTVILTASNKSSTKTNEIQSVKAPTREVPIPMAQPKQELKPKSISRPKIQERLTEQTVSHEAVFEEEDEGYGNDPDKMSIDEIARRDIELMSKRQEGELSVKKKAGRPSKGIPMPDANQVAQMLDRQMNQTQGAGADYLNSLAGHFMQKNK